MEGSKVLTCIFLFAFRRYVSHEQGIEQTGLYSDSENFGHNWQFSAKEVYIQSGLSDSISYGELVFFEKIVTSTNKIYNTKPRSYIGVCSCNSFSFCRLSLLLCGDIHPCPGPAAGQPTNGNNFPDEDTSKDFLCFKKRGLNIIHMNIRSLLPKIDEVRLIARETKASCICLTETWLRDTIFDSEVSIDNYVIQRKDRNRHGGGVCLYIRNGIAFNSRSDLDHDELESLCVNILLPKTKPILCV